MILHDASSGTIVHGVSLFLWQHSHPGDIMILLWLTRSLQNFAQHMRLGVVSICGLGEFGGVPLRENVPGIFLLPRADGHQLVHGPGSKCS